MNPWEAKQTPIMCREEEPVSKTMAMFRTCIEVKNLYYELRMLHSSFGGLGWGTKGAATVFFSVYICNLKQTPSKIFKIGGRGAESVTESA